MNKETLRQSLDLIEDIQRKAIRLGGRIQLTAIFEPDHKDVEVIPDDIIELKDALDTLDRYLGDTVFGKYDVVYYAYTEGDPEPRWRRATPSGYKLAKQRADSLNRMSQEAENIKEVEGYFMPVSLDDMEYEGVFDVTQGVHFS